MTNKPMLSVERELLEELQWHYKPYDDHYHKESGYYCPMCGSEKSQGHDEKCEIKAVFDNPVAQHQPAPTDITDDIDRLMEAYRRGEFSAEGGSDTVEALSVASFDAVESHGYDADSYMAGYCAALYEQTKPFIWMALKPQAEQPAPVADQAQCEECKGWGYHENHHEGGGTECGECGGSGNATVAVVIPDHTIRSVMDAIQQARGFPVLTSNQCHALAESLNYVARLNGVKP